MTGTPNRSCSLRQGCLFSSVVRLPPEIFDFCKDREPVASGTSSTFLNPHNHHHHHRTATNSRHILLVSEKKTFHFISPISSSMNALPSPHPSSSSSITPQRASGPGQQLLFSHPSSLPSEANKRPRKLKLCRYYATDSGKPLTSLPPPPSFTFLFSLIVIFIVFGFCCVGGQCELPCALEL